MAILATDPLDILLDVNGDIDLSNGGPHFVSGVDGIAQLCAQALKTFAGEWFAERTVGIPYYDNDYVTVSQAILGQKFSQEKVTRAFSRELLKIPGVGRVTSMTVLFDNKSRTLGVAFEVKAVWGDTVNSDIAIGVSA